MAAAQRAALAAGEPAEAADDEGRRDESTELSARATSNTFTPKLGVANRTAATAYAYEHHLV